MTHQQAVRLASHASCYECDMPLHAVISENMLELMCLVCGAEREYDIEQENDDLPASLT